MEMPTKNPTSRASKTKASPSHLNLKKKIRGDCSRPGCLRDFDEQALETDRQIREEEEPDLFEQ